MVHGRSEGAVPYPRSTSADPGLAWEGAGRNASSPRPPGHPDWRNRGVARRLGRGPTHWAVPIVALCTAGVTWGLARQGWLGMLPPTTDGAGDLAATPAPTTTTRAVEGPPGSGAALTTDTTAPDTTPSTDDVSPTDPSTSGVPAAAPGPTATPRSPTTGGAPPPAPTTAPRPPTTTAPTSRPPASGIFVGSIEPTPYGPVVVVAVLSAGRLVDVRFDTYPKGDQTSLATSYLSLPALRDRSLAAQSANVDAVSQATYTSKAYRASLQSALDLAGFR